jgi:hypothetical protein
MSAYSDDGYEDASDDDGVMMSDDDALLDADDVRLILALIHASDRLTARGAITLRTIRP